MQALDRIVEALEGIEQASCITVVLFASFLMFNGIMLLMMGVKK